jgi:hypothetical protein
MIAAIRTTAAIRRSALKGAPLLAGFAGSGDFIEFISSDVRIITTP